MILLRMSGPVRNPMSVIRGYPAEASSMNFACTGSCLLAGLRATVIALSHACLFVCVQVGTIKICLAHMLTPALLTLVSSVLGPL